MDTGRIDRFIPCITNDLIDRFAEDGSQLIRVGDNGVGGNGQRHIDLYRLVASVVNDTGGSEILANQTG
jgi:hypothetical protein